MDSKEKIKKDVELALRTLHQTIDSLKEKVDKLCESTGCFNTVPTQIKPKKDDK
jgi:hypothetical protein|tara:strand:- start:584 stop:745 length:162 start_codon:yes stop_codon:yes gene_type:complete